MKKLLVFVGLSFVTGFIWGLACSPAIPQRHLGPQIHLGQYDQMVTVDVVRNNDDIWIIDHKTGHLIFEYNRFKEVDKKAFKEYEDLLTELHKRKRLILLSFWNFPYAPPLLASGSHLLTSLLLE